LSGDARAGAGRADAERGAETDARLNAVVGVNAADVFRAAVFVNAGIVIRRGAVDALALNRRGVNTRLAAYVNRAPRHRNGLARRGRGRGAAAGSAAAGRACCWAAVRGFKDGVSHAARLAIENDVLDRADFAAIRGADT